MKKIRIALIDNDPNFIDLFRRATLSDCPDFLITAYESGSRFLEVLPLLNELEQPDLILLDLGMPKLDGYATARLIRKNQAYQHTPILLLTVADQSEITDQQHPQIVDAFLPKPFSFQEMKRFVKVLCTDHLELNQLPY